MIFLFVAIPLACAFSIPLFSKLHKNSAPIIANLGLACLSALSLGAVSWARKGVLVYSVGGWKAPLGIALALDSFGVLLLLVINIVGWLSLIYTYSYIKKFSSRHYFYTLFCLLIAGLNGVAITGDLFNLFVFLEITSIASYALVAFGTEAEELEASLKYLILGSIASSMVLLGIGLLYGKFSTLNMADLANSIRLAGGSKLVLFSLALFIFGFGLKAGLVPFHTWLPDAHPAAPAPVSAMLSGVVIKTIGVYALVRVIFNIFGVSAFVLSILAWLGIISMVIGVLLAIGQWDFKRLLAYHSISQIGYVIFGIALGTPLGIAGGLFHLLNHSVFKALLFLNSGSVEYAAKTRRLDQLGGLSKKMPVTSGTSMIASLSIAGIPPFCGFWSKLIIIIAAFEANHIVGAIACIFVSVVTLASFLKVQNYAFLRKKEGISDLIKEVPLTMAISMIAFAVLCAAIGLAFPYMLDKIIFPAQEVLTSGLSYAQSVLGR